MSDNPPEPDERLIDDLRAHLDLATANSEATVEVTVAELAEVLDLHLHSVSTRIAHDFTNAQLNRVLRKLSFSIKPATRTSCRSSTNRSSNPPRVKCGSRWKPSASIDSTR